MNDRKTETLYLRRRVSDSLAMAAAAAGPCAQIAHLTLARLYSEAIDALIARPTLHALLSTATRVEFSARVAQATPVILASAHERRHVASPLSA